MTRVPAAFRAQHELVWTTRKHTGSSHAYGRECTIPVSRYPWRCSCGAEGREGGESGPRGHREHVRTAWGARDKYECDACGGTGSQDDEGLEGCENCDSLGITAIDCPGCGREAVPIHETVFVAAEPKTYCEACGDERLNKIAVSRGLSRY